MTQPQHKRQVEVLATWRTVELGENGQQAAESQPMLIWKQARLDKQVT